MDDAPISAAGLRQMAEIAADLGTPIVVFSDTNFQPILENWLAAIRRTGLRNYVVFALDSALQAALEKRGVPSIHVPFDGSFGGLMAHRLKVFRQLCSEGIDFVHSDADAVWFADPMDAYFSDPAADLTFSQGICHPRDVYESWGFVLCCGLFGARASTKTKRFFDRILAEIPNGGDDQTAVNRILRDDGMTWNVDPSNSYRISAGTGDQVLCAEIPFHGMSRDSDLVVSVLPHRQFQRLGMPADGAYVRHVYASKDIGKKIARLKQRNCWVLDDDRPKNGWLRRTFNVVRTQAARPFEGGQRRQ